jgi:hydroxymethylbilane synthase
MKIKIATRGSKLALWQAERVKMLLLEKHPQLTIELLEVTRRGDIDQKTPLSAFGNTGVFVKGLEEKLLSGEADMAVHTLILIKQANVAYFHNVQSASLL